MRHFVRVNINHKNCTFFVSAESSFFNSYNVCFFEIVANFIQKLVKYKCLIYIVNIVETIMIFIV